MRALVILVIVGAAAIASADSAARQRAGRAVFERMVKALSAHRYDEFANLFVNDTRAAAMFPASRSVAVGRRAIRVAAETWAGSGRSPLGAAVTGTPIVGVRPDEANAKRSDRLVVVTGDLDVTVRGRPQPIGLRMTTLLVAGMSTSAPDLLTPIAVFVSQPVDDAALRGEDLVGENKEIDRFLDLIRFPDVMVAHFDAAPDDVVIGSSATERGKGADATKVLARWKDLRFAIVGKPTVFKDPEWMYVIGRVSLARASGRPVPLNVLLVGYPECAASCAGTGLTPHVVALHFGQPI